MLRQPVSSMPVDALIKLRNEIDEALKLRLEKTRKELAELEGGLIGLESASVKQQPRKKPAPKYLGPNGETWTGRGLTPRWLKALLKQGHAIEEFAIDSGVQTARKAGNRSKRS